MTDLPADPSAWDLNDELATTDDPSGVSTSSAGDADGGDDEPSKLPVPVVYDTLDTYTPKVSWKALVGPLVAVALVSIGLGLIMARGGDDEKAGTDATAAPTTVAAPTTAAPTSSAAPTTVAVPTTSVATTAPAPTTTVAPAPTTTVAPAPTTTVAPAPTTTPTTAAPEVQPAPPVTFPAVSPGDVDLVDPVRYAEFTDGKVYLHGRVPSAELAQRIIDKAAAVVGKDNVVVDYVVDPTAPAVAGGPLRVTNTVQFEPDSTTIRPEFGSILGLGVLLMQQNPNVQIIVVGRADPRGGSGYNFRLSQARAQAVVDYITFGTGIDPGRLTVDARGADDPLAEGDDLAANAANRSVEFIILGLID